MTLRVSRLFVPVLGLLLGNAGHAQALRENLRPVGDSSRQQLESQIDRSLLPDGATAVKVDPRQSFDLVTSGKKTFTVFSVSFRVPRGPVSPLFCGVFLRSADGAQIFFNPISDDLPIVCEGITAVRLRRTPEGPPGFIFTGQFTSGARAWNQRFTISWDKVTGKYTLDSLN